MEQINRYLVYARGASPKKLNYDVQHELSHMVSMYVCLNVVGDKSTLYNTTYDSYVETFKEFLGSNSLYQVFNFNDSKKILDMSEVFLRKTRQQDQYFLLDDKISRLRADMSSEMRDLKNTLKTLKFKEE